MVARDLRLSKITRPKTQGVLLRQKLFAQLDKKLDNNLIWVSSPGGAGKTTLISSYVSDRQLPCLWYQVDSGDNDAATFFYYLGLAGKKAAPQLKKPLPLLTPEYLKGLSAFSRHYFADLFNRLQTPSVMVFDNVQEVEDSASFHQCLLDGLSRIPEEITIILISRSDPPAAYLNYQANRSMAVFDWHSLRLSFDEFEKVISCWGFDTETVESLPALYTKMDGWAAGLQLLLRHARGSSLEGVGNWLQTPEEIFGYFAEQLFSRVEEDVQECLLRTAFVSKISLEMAENLSGNPRSRTILKELAHRNYFTSKRQDAVTTYEYHPLFQLFLQETAREKYSATELAELKMNTAHALLAESRTEEAVELLTECGSWEELTTQILENAQTLLAQGRFETLQGWFAALPPEWIEQNPWLLYWQAAGLKPISVMPSREKFKRSYDLFRAANDPVGAYMAWTGIVETFIYLWGNFRLLDPWLEEFKRLRQDFPDFPNPEIQARVTYSVFSALLWRKSNSEEMKIWSRKAEELIQKSDNPVFKVLTSSNMLKFYLWCQGDLAKADQLITILRRIDQKTVPPLITLLSKVMMATYYFFKNDMDACVQEVDGGLELGSQTGIHIMDTALYAHGTYALLMTGELEGASFYLKQMEALTNEQSHIDVAHYHYLYVWKNLEEEKVVEALNHAKIAVARIDAAGTRQARGFARYTLAITLCENGEYQEAKEALDIGRAYGIAMQNDYFESVYQLCLALLALRQGDHSEAVARVGKGLGVARRKAYPTLPWIGWYRSALTELLQLALENDLEVDYAARLIRDHHLQPKTPPLHLQNWPWPLKIYTLGAFEVHRYGEPLRSSGKAQQKPLALLKAIIALGGKDVPEEGLLDALWPDADGDAAHQSLKTALHRLRKLIGLPEAITYGENSVSLDPRFCWVDVWVLDRLLPQAKAARTMPVEASAISRALTLYRGNFLASEPSDAWIIPARERWRSRFLHGTEYFAEQLVQKGKTEEAIECYLKALQVDPLVELFYQRLMLCYKQLNRPASALSVYERCRSILDKTLGIKPSSQTEDLRKSFLPKV